MGSPATASTYIGEVMHFAFRKTLTYTDSLSGIVGVLVPAILFVMKKPAMGDWLPGAAAWFVIIVVGGSAFLRLVTAPYFVWREQQSKISEIEAQLKRPDEQIRASLDQKIAESRIEIMGYATRITQPPMLRQNTVDQFKLMFEHEGVLQHLYHLSYDDEFLRLWDEFKNEVYNIVRYVPKRPEYLYNADTIRYHEQSVVNHWAKADKTIDALRHKLSRHLFMKT